MSEKQTDDVNEFIELDEAALIRETMVGEYMELTLNTLKGMDETFHRMDEREQSKFIQRLQQQAMLAIGRMTKLVASADSTTLRGFMVDVKKGKKEISAKLEFSLNDEAQAELFQFANRHVLVTLLDEADFINTDDLPEADPDQPPLNGFE